jgi:autotransporter-associated beta strand protein
MRNLAKFVILFGLSVTVFPPGSAVAQSILISSNSGSGSVGLFTNQSYSYNFGITTLGSGQNLTLTNIGIYTSRGTSTSQPLNIVIYGGLGATGPVLTNFTVAASNVPSGNIQLFNVLFDRSLVLTNGNYSMTLSSSTASGGNTQYSLRQGLLSLNDASGNPLPLTYWVQDSNTSGTASTNFQANFVLADYRITTNAINFGNYRVGSALSTAVALTNTAIFATNATGGLVSENLSTVVSTTNAATVAGLSTNLLAVGQTTNFTVGLSSAAAGPNSGLVTLLYNSVSNGTASVRPASLGTNPVGVGAQEIAVSGVGYRLADDAVSTTNVDLGNFRVVDGAGTGTVTISNTAAADGFSEGLGVANAGLTGGATVTNLPGALIAAGGSSAVTVGLGAAQAGINSGTVTFGFASDGAGTSGFGATNIGSQLVTVTGIGYRLASESVATTNVNLGRFHIGASNITGVLGLTNTATADGFSEGLAVADNGTSGGATVGGIPGGLIAAGAHTNLTVGLGSIASVGTNSGTVALGFQSSGAGTSGFAATNIGSQMINVTAQGYSGQAVWSTDTGGRWNNFDNWDVPGGTPGIDGVLSTNDTATFGAAISSARTVTLDGQNPVLTSLSFSNAAASYTIAPGSGGSITMGTENAANPAIAGHAGAHTVAADLALAATTEVAVTSGARLTFDGSVSGTGGVVKRGLGRLDLSGTSSYTGATVVEAGELKVNGSIANSAVTIQSGASLSGSGTVGVISGAGSVDPGNSPGILTAPAVDSSGTLTFNFEFTNLNPIFTDPFASVNDVLRLTDPTAPFSGALTSANVLNIYFNVDVLQTNELYRGAFFTDRKQNFDALIVDAKFNYYIKDDAGPVSYGGQNYALLGGGFSIVVSTVNQSADFGSGLVDGQITQFEVIPEPSTYALLVLGAAALGFHAWRRRRRA